MNNDRLYACMSKAAYISEYDLILQHISLTEYIPLLVLNMQTPAYYV